MPVRVHLADDHTMFRQGLEAILASREGVEVVGASSTGPEAAERVRETKPDVIVTQLDMQPKTAQEIIEGLSKASPGSRIVVLTMWDNLRYVQAIAKMGIDAYLHKTSSAEELVATIGSVSREPSGQNVVGLHAPRPAPEDRRGACGRALREGDGGYDTGRARPLQPAHRRGAAPL